MQMNKTLKYAFALVAIVVIAAAFFVFDKSPYGFTTTTTISAVTTINSTGFPKVNNFDFKEKINQPLPSDSNLAFLKGIISSSIFYYGNASTGLNLSIGLREYSNVSEADFAYNSFATELYASNAVLFSDLPVNVAGGDLGGLETPSQHLYFLGTYVKNNMILARLAVPMEAYVSQNSVLSYLIEALNATAKVLAVQS